MAGTGKIRVELDADEVARAREVMGVGADEPDDAVVARVLNGYLLGRLIDRVQRRFDLSEEEAEKLAYEELHAMRRDRRRAA